MGAGARFAGVAEEYLSCGFTSIFPLAGKWPPPEGRTGYAGVDASSEEVRAWIAADAGPNIAWRIPVGVIGIDVDHTPDEGKFGDDQLLKAIAELGPLPPTWSITSREDTRRRTMFYLVPPELNLARAQRRLTYAYGEHLPSGRMTGWIDVIRHDHRYSVLPPSTHPDTGQRYAWFDPAGNSPVPPPRWREALADLPARWCEFLAEASPGEPQAPAAAPLVAELGDFVTPSSVRTFTLAEAIEWCRPAMEALAGAQPGSINLLLNDAAITLAHFSPNLWSDEDIQTWCLKALESTVYDGRTWVAENTIRSALNAPKDWLGYKRDEPSPAPAVRAEKSEQPSGPRTLKKRSLSGVKPTRVKWLWQGRMAAGELSLLGGREGKGKSTIVYWIIARITRGELPGEYFGQPRNVYIATTEDSLEHTIAPRLLAAGADMERVIHITVQAEGYDDELILPTDVAALREAMTEDRPALLMLDPLMSRLSGRLDSHRDAEVRLALEPLAALAHETEMAVLGLIHMNKSGSSDPMDVLMGSRAFTAVARSVSLVLDDPEDEDGKRRLFATPKNNLGTTDLPSLSYTIVGAEVAGDGCVVSTALVQWGEETVTTASEALGRSVRPQEAPEGVSARAHALEWLLAFLVDERGGIAEAVEACAEAAGDDVATRTLKRAAEENPKLIVSDFRPPGGGERGRPRRVWSITPEGRAWYEQIVANRSA